MLAQLEKLIETFDSTTHQCIGLSLVDAKTIRDQLRELEKIKQQQRILSTPAGTQTNHISKVIT